MREIPNQPLLAKDYLPHESPFPTIDLITAWEDAWIECEALHQEKTPFTLADGRTPSWVCLEYIAQSAAAFDGLRRSRESLAPRIAFLLGTRKMNICQAYFEKNERIKIQSTLVLEAEGGVSVFDAKVFSSKSSSAIASARVKAIAPENVLDIIRKKKLGGE